MWTCRGEEKKQKKEEEEEEEEADTATENAAEVQTLLQHKQESVLCLKMVENWWENGRNVLIN